MPKKIVKAVKEVKAPKKANEFVVTFGYNGQKEVIKGTDLMEIFKDWSPRIFKTVITLEVTKGEQTIQRRLPVVQARRISGNYKFADIYAHGLLKFFK